MLCCNCYSQTIEDIKEKMGVKPKAESTGEKEEGEKGFKQLVGKYYVVQVKDISREEAEKILQYMDTLMEEFLKLYEYPFGTQKCYIVVYGLKKDYDRIAKAEDMENAEAFSYRKGINEYAVTYYVENIYPLLSHEAFHLFIEYIFKGDVPFWFNEGMACYYERCTFVGTKFVTNRINKGRLMVAKDSIRTKQWPRLKELVRFSYDGFYRNNSAVNYAASWCLVYYLKNKNEEAFKNFVNDFVMGKSFSTAIRQNYNMEQKQLEDEWIKYIEGLSVV